MCRIYLWLQLGPNVRLLWSLSCSCRSGRQYRSADSTTFLSAHSSCRRLTKLAEFKHTRDSAWPGLTLFLALALLCYQEFLTLALESWFQPYCRKNPV